MSKQAAIEFLKSYLEKLQVQYGDLEQLCPQDLRPLEDPPRTSADAERCARLADRYGFDGNLFRNLLPSPPDPDAVDYEQALAKVRREIETIPRIIVRMEGRSRKRAPKAPIPPEDRTIPMSYRRAATLMGKGASKDAAEWVSACVADGTIRCEHKSRQAHVFSKQDFPKGVWRSILPSSSNPKSL